MAKWATKTLQLATCFSIFVAKNTGVFNAKIYFLALLHQLKNVGVKAFMKLTPRVNFIKPKCQKLCYKNTKIFMAFSLFNFIKALMPKFSPHYAKNDAIFKVQFNYRNLVK